MSLYIYPPTPISISIPTPIVVDIFDAPLLNVAVDGPIPKISTLGAGARLEVVASLAISCSKITISEDIGEYIGIYVGAANAEILKCVLPLGGGEMSIDFPAGARISLGHMKDTDLTTATFIAITFIG